jgi:(1->4)-alpha-D-glucan 1-alpha-D-glucosylmutase
MLNSLSQTLLKFTAPGVPDTYQGTELWDFSLVDPDNRRPVDYARRREMLAGLHAGSANPERVKNLVRDLLATREDGRIKMYVTSRALHCRRDYPELFANGSYLPLTTSGDKAAHVFAFARNAGKQWTLVAVPRLVAQLIPDSSKLPLGPATWDKTTLHLDGMSVGLRWRNVFTGATLAARDSFAAAEVFAGFPVAMLMADE